MSDERDEFGLESRRDGNVLHITLDAQVINDQKSQEALIELIKEHVDLAGIDSIVILPRKSSS